MPFVGTKPASIIETLFINNTTKTRVFGYLQPHGKTLPAATSRVFPCDIRDKMNVRELASLQRDIDSGAASIFVYRKMLLALPAATVPAILAGAPVFWNTTNNNVEPANTSVWGADLLTSQATFTDNFMGIAQQGKLANTANQMVQVDISPDTLKEFPCTSEAHEVDEFCSMAKDTGNNLLPNTLIKAVAASSPFRIRRKDATPATKVLVSWQSAFWGQNVAGNQ